MMERVLSYINRKELFRCVTTGDNLFLFHTLLETKEDLSHWVALALLKIIHKDLVKNQIKDRTLYKRYASEIEAFRFVSPALLQEVVDTWKESKN